MKKLLYIAIFLLTISLNCYGDLTNGLIAYYKMDITNNAICPDYSGYGRDSISCTIQGISNGIYNGSYSFDGSSSGVDFGDVGFLDNLTNVSISCWLNIKATNAFAIILGKNYNFDDVQFFIQSGNLYFRVADSVYGASGKKTDVIYTNITTGLFFNVIGNWNGTNSSLYINGNLVATSNGIPFILSNTTDRLSLGCGIAASGTKGYFYNGLIDDVRIYNRALSPSEINQLYYLSKPTYIGPNNLQGNFDNPVYIEDRNSKINFKNITVNGNEVIPDTKFIPLNAPQWVNMASIDGQLTGFNGGFSDGRYIYCVPTTYSKIARIDINNFTTAGVSFLDLNNASLKGFVGGFTDGKYGYLVPNNNGAAFGNVIRFDTQNFTTNGVTNVDLTLVNANLKGYIGGCTDGRYGYLFPFGNGFSIGKVVRIDLQNFTTGGVSYVDITSVYPNLNDFRNGFTDGKYLYCVGYGNSVDLSAIARIDLNNFTTNGLIKLNAFNNDFIYMQGGYTDGKFGYFIPNNNSTPYGSLVRVDLNNFTPDGIISLKIGNINTKLRGFNLGVGNQKYLYLPNWQSQGTFTRIDLNDFTTNGVSFISMTNYNTALTAFGIVVCDNNFTYVIPTSHGNIVRILTKSDK